jgi:cysteine desulfurase
MLFRGRNGEALQVGLDLAGFAVSTGSACHSGSVKPSHTILTLGYSLEDARSVLRFSWLPDAQPSEMEALAAALKRLT